MYDTATPLARWSKKQKAKGETWKIARMNLPHCSVAEDGDVRLPARGTSASRKPYRPREELKLDSMYAFSRQIRDASTTKRRERNFRIRGPSRIVCARSHNFPCRRLFDGFTAHVDKCPDSRSA